MAEIVVKAANSIQHMRWSSSSYLAVEKGALVGTARNAQCSTCCPTCDDTLQHLVISNTGIFGDAIS